MDYIKIDGIELYENTPKFRIINGNLFDLAFKGEFDVIAQGCNCFNTQGAGISLLFKKYFQTDKFSMELSGKGDQSKLGKIDYKKFVYNENFNEDNPLFVVNCYTQYYYGVRNGKIPLSYDALRECLKKINDTFKGKKIGLPLIGGGLAGGDPEIIKQMIEEILVDCYTTLVIYKKE